jgi:hypothetical protein
MTGTIRSAFGIYHVLEVLLRDTDHPMTCVELFDKPDVRQFAETANRVSDYLGHMWRRQLLDRVPAPKTSNSQARWAYIWKGKLNEAAQKQVVSFTKTAVPPSARQGPVEVAPEVSGVVPSPEKSILSKPSIEITQNGETVTIDLPALSITIRMK